MSAAAETLLAPKDVHVHLRSSKVVEKEDSKITTEKNNRPLSSASVIKELDVGAKFSLKEQMEKDKGDETQKGWKRLILGSIMNGSAGSTLITDRKEPEVNVLSVAIQCPGSGRPDLVLPIPLLVSNGISKRTLFVLREGCRCRTKFSFTVSDTTVSGLRYTYAVWKAGVRVGNTKTLIGTFSPRQEAYSYELAEETIPTGLFVRGTYFVKTKFVDDAGKCYLEFCYYFEIRKNWP